MKASELLHHLDDYLRLNEDCELRLYCESIVYDDCYDLSVECVAKGLYVMTANVKRSAAPVYYIGRMIDGKVLVRYASTNIGKNNTVRLSSSAE